MKVKEIIPTGEVHAEIVLPGSKSLTNRALVCASLAGGESLIKNYSDSDDTTLMINGLNQLGVLVRKGEDALLVQGKGGRLYAPRYPISVGNAGTTARFLAALAALSDGPVSFEASDRMTERPMEQLLEALHRLGTKSMPDSSSSRYTVIGGTFSGGRTRVMVNESSQFLSALLMIAPYARNDVTLDAEDAPVSLPYVNATVQVMARFGVHVQNENWRQFHVESGERYKPATYVVESDASSASYFLAAAAVAGGQVRVNGIHRNMMQGDSGFLAILEAMGCTIIDSPEGIVLRSSEKLTGVDVEMNTMPDVVPTLAVVALFANGRTVIRNVPHLKHKESDRLAALANELTKLGAKITISSDSIEVTPATLHGGQLDTYDDHRLVMSFAVAGLKVHGVRVENPNCVTKSFPRFWYEFEKLYKV